MRKIHAVLAVAAMLLCFSIAAAAADGKTKGHSSAGEVRVTLTGPAPVKARFMYADKSYRVGHMTVSGTTYDIYLPIRDAYSTILTSEDVTLQPDCTSIAVDTKRSGEIVQSDFWLSCWPIRFGDEMYEVKAIDPKGMWIDFARSAAPLAGISAGQQLPAFSFTTTAGQAVSNTTYRGKYLLLDVWSMT